MVTVTVDAAAIHDDGGEDNRKEKVDEVHAVKVHLIPPMSAQTFSSGVAATHDGVNGIIVVEHRKSCLYISCKRRECTTKLGKMC